jgi:hypothetical protein
MNMRKFLFLLAGLLMVLGVLLFVQRAIGSDNISGNWEGESICTVRPSPCNDEHVIYHVTVPDKSGNVKMQADKIVNGQPEFMGAFDCNYDQAAAKLTCPMGNGKWEFAVTSTTMAGTLKLPDGTLYRNVSVRKIRKDK